MKTIYNLRQIGLFIIIALGFLFAFLSGNFIADENFLPLILGGGFMALAILVLGIGRYVYLMMPVFWVLIGSVSILPVPFDVRELSIILASVVFFSELIFKTSKIRPVYERIDLLLWLNLLYLLSVWIRNPVGFNTLGGGARVGGKPYVDVVLGIMAYVMLSRFRITPGQAEKLPLYVLIASLFTSFAGLIGTFNPFLGSKLAWFYSGFSPGVDSLVPGQLKAAQAGETRLDYFQGTGIYIITYVISRINPLHLLHPKQILGLVSYLTGAVMILLSGFRNAIFGMLLLTGLATIVRERFTGLVKIGTVLFFVVGGIVLLSYSSVELPFTAQRALCFLPGQWDPSAVADAKQSSEWRFEMWRIALTSDKYIHDKVFGDGFGFLRSDYEKMEAAMFGMGAGLGGEQEGLEAFLIDGDYHSGPVSAIRFVGYVGLGLFIPLTLALAFYAWNLIKESARTPYQFSTLFFGLPVILFPIYFLFIFGDFRKDLVFTLFSIGLFKMISGSLRDFKQSQESHGSLDSVEAVEDKTVVRSEAAPAA
jgi:hypothetical protein